MRAPSGFEARLQEMNVTLQQRKQVLEVERQLQSTRKTTLQEANAKVEQIQRLACAMRDKAGKVSSEIDRLERKRGAEHVRLEDILYKIRLLAEQIIGLEQEKEETSKFYQKNKEEMEIYQKKFLEENSSLQHEINELQKQYEELTRNEADRKKEICEVDTAIQEEEEKHPKLVSLKEEIIHEIASNSIKAEKLEATVKEAEEESKKKNVELEAILIQRRDEVIALQKQNQYWEKQVYLRIQSRTHCQRELEKLGNKIAQATKALYG